MTDDRRDAPPSGCSPTRSASSSTWSPRVEPALDRPAIAESWSPASRAAGPSGAGWPRPCCERPARAASTAARRRPRAVGDLLIALRAAGAADDLAAGLRRVRQAAAHPAAPRPGLVLRGLRAAGASPARPAGRPRPVDVRDRHGRPRCVAVPDPTTGVTRSPSSSTSSPDRPARCRPDVVAAAVTAAAPRAGQRSQLAWALQDRPDLLTGAGAAGTRPAVLRLIDTSARPGRRAIVRPPCPRCRRVDPLATSRIDGQRLCRNCVAKSRAEPCSRCGARPRTGHPRRARPAAVSQLLDHRPGQPGDLHRLRPPPPGQRPHPGRAALPDLPARGRS